VRFSYSRLAEQFRYIYHLKSYIDLTLFALVAKVIQSAGYKWGHMQFTMLLEEKNSCWPTPAWGRFVRGCTDHIKSVYDKAAKATRQREEYELNYAKFFKTPSWVATIMNGSIAPGLRRLAREALES
jgi:hypothetical protein